MADFEYQERELPFEKGDILALVTDGVTECVNVKGELFGIERAENVLLQSRNAEDFIGKLRARTSDWIDLPTEAQWEYACRAGTTTLYSTGDNELSDRVKYHLDNLPNAWGFYYMGTAKSCEACIGFLEIHYGTKHVIDPLGPTYMEAKGIWPTKGGVGDYGSNRRMGWDWDDDASHWNATFRVALWCDRD
jgi:hypothetical protein